MTRVACLFRCLLPFLYRCSPLYSDLWPGLKSCEFIFVSPELNSPKSSISYRHSHEYTRIRVSSFQFISVVAQKLISSFHNPIQTLITAPLLGFPIARRHVAYQWFSLLAMHRAHVCTEQNLIVYQLQWLQNLIVSVPDITVSLSLYLQCF